MSPKPPRIIWSILLVPVAILWVMTYENDFHALSFFYHPGAQTKATVQKISRSVRFTRATHYYVDYTFTDRGHTFLGSDRITYQGFKTLKEGSALTIRYSPSSPEISQAVDYRDKLQDFELVFYSGLLAFCFWVVGRRLLQRFAKGANP